MARISQTRFARWLLSALLGAAGVISCFPALAQDLTPQQLQDQIGKHMQALDESRAAKQPKNEATERLELGLLYLQAGEAQQALDTLTPAQPILRELGDRTNEATVLNFAGMANDGLSQREKALECYSRAIQIWRELGEHAGEATTLFLTGADYEALGQKQTALNNFNQALPILREVGDRNGEFNTLAHIGSIYNDLGQKEKALEYDNKALKVTRDIRDRSNEAVTLSNLGLVNNSMGRERESLEYYDQALPIFRDIGDHGGEAVTLLNIGGSYNDLGQAQKALEYFNQALPILHQLGNRNAEAAALNDIGQTYADLGENQKCLDYSSRALAMFRSLGDRRSEARMLINIGGVYDGLGQKQEALKYFYQALPVLRETGDRRSEAAALLNVGNVYRGLGQDREAAGEFSQTLTIAREVGDRSMEGRALSLSGGASKSTGRMQEALASWRQALVIEREVGDRTGEADTLVSIALVSDATVALRNELAALSLSTALSNRHMEGLVEAALMKYFRHRGDREIAILFGMDSVNSFQQMRKNISGLEKDLQASFAQSNSDFYRDLAELLVEDDRLGEAEQVLDLLKEQELKDVVRGATTYATAKMEPLKLSAAQLKAQSELAAATKKALDLTDLTHDVDNLQANESRTTAQEIQLKGLDSKIEQGDAEIQAIFLNRVAPELERNPSSKAQNGLELAEESKQSYLQNSLAKLGPRVMGIRLLLGASHAYAIVVTSSARKKIELPATPSELRKRAFQALEDLRSPGSDPKPRLEELYGLVVAPLESELKALEVSGGSGRVPTLLWSLDGALRYLPMAALYDGHHYMVERFNNVLFTPESYGHLTDSPVLSGSRTSGLAMGLSKSYGGLPALSGVLPELEAVVHDPAVPASHGPMEGRLLANGQFTLAALETELGSGKTFPIVHIASHFVVNTSGGEEPFLMLGGEDAGKAEGYAWSLTEMENSPISFHGTQLLALSACSTGKDYTNRDGLEMDSLGMIAQQKNAEAVLAALWDVNDASTSELMSDFYSRWIKTPADGKAEALRQAQLAFLRGPETAPSSSGTRRGLQTEEKQASGYSHPFYWAPFVLGRVNTI